MSIELSYIRDITKEEHREFMEFLRMKTRILFNHEVAVALDQGKTPKNSYQGIFHQSQCLVAEPNGNVKIFFCIHKRVYYLCSSNICKGNKNGF